MASSAKSGLAESEVSKASARKIAEENGRSRVSRPGKPALSTFDPPQRMFLQPRQSRLTPCRRDTLEIATSMARRAAFHPPTGGANLDPKVRPSGLDEKVATREEKR